MAVGTNMRRASLDAPGRGAGELRIAAIYRGIDFDSLDRYFAQWVEYPPKDSAYAGAVYTVQWAEDIGTTFVTRTVRGKTTTHRVVRAVDPEGETLVCDCHAGPFGCKHVAAAQMIQAHDIAAAQMVLYPRKGAHLKSPRFYDLAADPTP